MAVQEPDAAFSAYSPLIDENDSFFLGHLPSERVRRGSEARRSGEQAFETDVAEELNSIMNSGILTSILNTTSNPVSPGPSSPPLEQTKSTDFIPPTRPSSTPFPNSEPRDSICCLSASDDASDILDLDEEPVPPLGPKQVSALTTFGDLPTEIHEGILDHLFGFRVSTTSKSSVVNISWGTALRHSRRRELSDLAMVSPTWRVLIQSRLYRHIKLKATQESLDQAMDYFVQHDHLRQHVKHLEIWFPVFQTRYGPQVYGNTLTLASITMEGLTNAMYTSPANNCSLREVLEFTSLVLPRVCVLTLEGGERKKAPKVHNFPARGFQSKRIAQIPSVRTLVTKGQWNLIREEKDFHLIMSALPNMSEWHGSYSRPKSKGYLSMARILPSLPANITHLNLCLECDYRREMAPPGYFLKVQQKVHFCARLAEATPALEHLSYTGRVCKTFFDVAALRTNPRATKLKSIDLTLKNICRPEAEYLESGNGIQDMRFIHCFESLVLSGVRSMEHLTALDNLRIRYIDLDSIVPPLNPYFIYRDGSCSGVWSDNILAELVRVRPKSRFEDLSETFGELGFNKEGRLVISTEYGPRILSLKLSNYQLIQQAVTIS